MIRQYTLVRRLAGLLALASLLAVSPARSERPEGDELRPDELVEQIEFTIWTGGDGESLQRTGRARPGLGVSVLAVTYRS